MIQELINKGYTPERAIEMAGIYDTLTEGYDFSIFENHKREGNLLSKSF